MNLSSDHDRSVACAQYALDLLEPTERKEFETAMQQDSSLAVEVGIWQDRFHSLSQRNESIEPSEQLWPRILAALPQAPAKQPVSTTPPVVNNSFWERLSVWRTISGLAVTGCIMLAGLLWLREPPVQVYVAVLESPQQQAGWMVQASTGGVVRLIPIGPAQVVPVGKALELWTKPAEMEAPVSLGIVKPGEPIVIELNKLPGLGAAQLFAISLEPPTGSPTGAPTGPILFAGNTNSI
jgi:anti-sigma-K factor RskA